MAIFNSFLYVYQRVKAEDITVEDETVVQVIGWLSMSKAGQDALKQYAKIQPQGGENFAEAYNRVVLQREAKYTKLTGDAGGHYHSQAAQSLRDILLGGSNAASSSGDPDAVQASSGAQPAKPETLRFAEELANNVSISVKEFNEQTYAYSGSSSNPLDSACNSINGMIKKTQSFLTLMNDIAGPGGQDFLKQQSLQFLEGTAQDIVLVSDELVNKGIQTVKCSAGQTDACSVGWQVDFPMKLSGGMTFITSNMKDLQGILPQVVKNLKVAKKEVGAVSGVISSISQILGLKAPPLLLQISKMYKTVWVIYFIFFFLFSVTMLFYAFWSHGWFGGPQADTAGSSEPPQTFGERMGSCFRSCTACIGSCTSGHLCFWSLLLLAQVIILILFLVSLLICILAGVQAFLGAGCSKIYLLGDNQVCTAVLGIFQIFLKTFGFFEPLEDTCFHRELLTCKIIRDTTTHQAIVAIVGGLLASVLSFQMLLDSATKHERARCIRALQEEGLLKKGHCPNRAIKDTLVIEPKRSRVALQAVTTKRAVRAMRVQKVSRPFRTGPGAVAQAMAVTEAAPAVPRRITKALISSAGRPTALDSRSRPKSLIDIEGSTLVAHVLRQLYRGGIKHVVFVVSHNGPLIIQELERCVRNLKGLQLEVVDLHEDYAGFYAASLLSACERCFTDATEPGVLLATADHIFDDGLVRDMCFAPLSPGVTDVCVLVDFSRDKWAGLPATTVGVKCTKDMQRVRGSGWLRLWHMQRKTASRMFTAQRFKDHIWHVVQKNSAKVQSLLTDAADTQETVDVFRLMNRFTLDTIGEIGFGTDIGSLDDPTSPFLASFDHAQKAAFYRFILPGPVWRCLRLLGVASEHNSSLHFRLLDDYSRQVVRDLSAHIGSNGAAGSNSFVGLFLQDAASKGEQLSENFLRDLVLNFLIAGRDTTAQARGSQRVLVGKRFRPRSCHGLLKGHHPSGLPSRLPVIPKGDVIMSAMRGGRPFFDTGKDARPPTRKMSASSLEDFSASRALEDTAAPETRRPRLKRADTWAAAPGAKVTVPKLQLPGTGRPRPKTAAEASEKDTAKLLEEVQAMQAALKQEEETLLMPPGLALHFLEDIIVFNATISACEKASEWIMALRVLQRIEEVQLVPNQTSFNAAVSACDRAIRKAQVLDHQLG
eukprot:s487_g6.t1